MAIEPCAQHHIRLVCDIDATLGTQIHTATPKSEIVEGPRAHLFVVVSRYPEALHAPCSWGDCDDPAPLCIFVSRRSRGILFHDQQDSGYCCLNRRRDLRNCLFNTDYRCLHRPRLSVPYPIIRRVGALTRVTGSHLTIFVSCALDSWFLFHCPFALCLPGLVWS